MNRALCILCSFILIFTWAENGSKGKNQQSAASLIISETREKDSNGEDETMNYDKKDNTGKLMQLTTQKGKTIIFQLNDSSAANALYNQLPLTIETENYGGNEKIFYPPEKLDVSNTPMAKGPAGTLSYYEPWGDVAIFYGECRGSSGLYELGEAVSGTEHISQITGQIELKKLDHTK